MARSHTNRQAIGARLRFEVLRRCNFACYYCGIPAALGLKVLLYGYDNGAGIERGWVAP